ncbi:MAG: hypothetical protein AAF901_12830, partial [Bacteroidota bacterium]
GIDRWWATAGGEDISVTWTVFVENEGEYSLTIDIDSSFSQPWNLTDNATVKIDGEIINDSFAFNRFISLGTLTKGFHEINIDSFDVPEQANVSEVKFVLSEPTQRGSRSISSLETFFIADQPEFDGKVYGINPQSLIQRYTPILHFDKGKDLNQKDLSPLKPNGFVKPFSAEQTWGTYKKPGYDVTGNSQDQFDLGSVYVDGSTYLGDGTIYASIVENENENELAINYYFHYPRSNWEYYGGSNTHEGDWEGVTVFVDRDTEEAKRVAFSQHVRVSNLAIGGLIGLRDEEGGIIVPWELLDINDDNNESFNQSFNVYVGLGGHASYPFPGITTFTRVKDGIPIPFSIAPEFHKGDYITFNENIALEKLPRVGSEDIKNTYPWLLYPGKWGDDKTAPRGPLFLKTGTATSPENRGQRWLDPWAWSAGFETLQKGKNTSRGAQIYLGDGGTNEIQIDDKYGILRGGEGNDIYTLVLASSEFESITNYDLGGSFIEDTGGEEDTLRMVSVFSTPELHPKLEKGKYGLARDGKNLIIDYNQDGEVGYEDDITIVDFFDSISGAGAGTGFIEQVANLPGIEIINFFSGGTPNDTVVNALTDDTTTTNQSILSAAQLDAVTTSNISTQPGFNDDPRFYYRYVLDDGNEITGRTDVNGKLNAVLPPNTDFDLFVYSTRTNRYEIISSDSGSSGSNQNREIELVRFGGQDTDGDGLPDVGEFT